MRIGVTFPQTEIGTDPAAVRDFAQAAEDLGYDHIACFDHVLGANPASRPDYRALYTHQTQFHEPFVLFGYLAGLTTSIELVTGIPARTSHTRHGLRRVQAAAPPGAGRKA